jgi:DNA-directed RNA polymerase subunit RPC12/RpoP
MGIHECEGCGRLFPRVNKPMQFISGHRIRITADEDDKIKCPYCGKKQEHGTLAIPV